MKTSELIGANLDLAVAYAMGLANNYGYEYSSDWSQGGPIIEREGIDLAKMNGGWMAQIVDSQRTGYTGPTPLIAAMRCYVASKLGNEVKIPEELLK